MIHWSAGNGNSTALINYLDRMITKYKESGGKDPKIKPHGWYHYVVDESGTWMLGDPEFNWGAHAGPPWNNHYIGVCIAHPIIASGTGRRAIGNRDLTTSEKKYKGTTCFELDPKVALATMELVKHLCDFHDIPFDLNTSVEQNVSSPDYAGIICHHHVTKRKWDCEPWMDELEAARQQILSRDSQSAVK